MNFLSFAFLMRYQMLRLSIFSTVLLALVAGFGCHPASIDAVAPTAASVATETNVNTACWNAATGETTAAITAAGVAAVCSDNDIIYIDNVLQCLENAGYCAIIARIAGATDAQRAAIEAQITTLYNQCSLPSNSIDMACLNYVQPND